MSQISSKLPGYIPFNAIDRSFLIPETDDPEGLYFPMSLVIGVGLKDQIDYKRLCEAVFAVEARFPQFRLGYELDYRSGRLRRVDEQSLAGHLSSIVQSFENGDLDLLVSQLVRENNRPLSRPVSILYCANKLIFRIHHSFGDGRFVMQLIAYILLAMTDSVAFSKLSDLPVKFGIPLQAVVWQNPRAGLATFLEFARTFTNTYSDYKGGSQMPAYAGSPIPVKTGFAMEVCRFLIPAPVLSALDQFRNSVATSPKVSLNTLLQVVLSARLVELGIQPQPVTYTVPVDLRRYLPDSRMCWPGNLSSQVRLRTAIRPQFDIAAECIDLQTQIDENIRRRLAIAGMPGEWLLAAAGQKTYRRVNRDWLLGSHNTDPRLFILSNLGKLDSDWQALLPVLSSDPVAFAIPLMGGPPLVLGVLFLQNEGHVTVTYNPHRFSRVQIETVMQAFTLEWLASNLAFNGSPKD